ncbi:AAA family ATPase [Acrocarpospora pleiomorpha]|uniref:ATP-binding protein n=1 Tax=Acrocarpospora pleiomorpha TaxID=90975 RepID=UPI0031D29FFC
MFTFVGRIEPLARLTAVYQALTTAPPGGRVGLALVTGEAGIGKTALLTRFAEEATAAGATVVWGTCWDADQAPAWWPWTQALRALLEQRAGLGTPSAELVAIVPELAADSPAAADADTTVRVRVFEAAGRLLADAAAGAPVVVILDDLHWADLSTVDLLRFLAGQHHPGALLLVGAYRPREPAADVAAALADLATTAELVPLHGMSPGEVADLIQAVAGAAVADRWAELVNRRGGGHPFCTRELCRLLAAGGPATEIPAAVRDVIGRRLARLTGQCAQLLEAAVVAGSVVLPDVLADVLAAEARIGPTRIAELAAEASRAGILTPADQAGPGRFTHDLYRETIYTTLPPARRLDLHQRVAAALLRRHERGGPVFAAELAFHFAAAVELTGPAPAMAWARLAADADGNRFAFTEAAGHLARVRSAVSDAGQPLAEHEQVDLLTKEAELRLRAGDTTRARALLGAAWTRATATGRGDLLGAAALGLDRVGARFAMPRTDLIAILDTARQALAGTGTPVEAQVTAALARQLQHSVPADRPRARPLAENAVAIARTLDDPATLASCLLAHHDTLWTPGTATDRAAISAEIAGLAGQAGDQERHAQALLLLATAQLESASAAFRATLAEYRHHTGRLRQPRHDYLLRTRQAALALLDGDIDTGERLSIEADALGRAVGDSDTGNVRMSQRLEIARARDDPAELRDMAAEAVRWWIGAPAHAHAVAAGFHARAGDLDTARRELDTVLALPDWRTDRSYLWSVFVGELAAAAIALDDRPLCRRLLDDLLPVADSCAVNGALVCFMGAHAHRVGLLYAALGQPAPARQWLDRALEAHRRLGAHAWQAETQRALATLDGAPQHTAHEDTAHEDTGGPRLRRVGDMWQATYRGQSAYLRDLKGLHDLAALLARPGEDRPALDLAGGDPVHAGADRFEPILDRTALAAYRRRLAELDDELAAAQENTDLGRTRRATDEREQLLTELRRATRPGGGSRPLAATAAERARKAVTARIRDAIRRVGEALPELGEHLDRTVRTGTTCRYDPGPAPR